MSHEGTAGVLTEAAAAGVQAIVQALASEPNMAVGDAPVDAGAVEEGEGTVVRAMEAIRAEVEQSAAERSGARTGMVGTALAAKVQTKSTKTKRVATKTPSKVMKAKMAPKVVKRVKGEAVKTRDIDRAAVVKADAKVREANTKQGLARRAAVPRKPQEKPLNLTVPEVWRSIVKKNERQGSKRYDVLVCQHAVPANDNTYRVARACPECRLRVQEYADGVAGSRAAKNPRRRKP